MVGDLLQRRRDGARRVGHNPGRHGSLGLGDYYYDRFGTPTNADLVGLMADLAETFGRPVADPEGKPARPWG